MPTVPEPISSSALLLGGAAQPVHAGDLAFALRAPAKRLSTTVGRQSPRE